MRFVFASEVAIKINSENARDNDTRHGFLKSTTEGPKDGLTTSTEGRGGHEQRRRTWLSEYTGE